MPDNGSDSHDSSKQERRSGHAKRRAREGRPVPEAISDARRARRSDVFYDVMEDRIIVRGSRGREHVFEVDGTQVTSFNRSHSVHLAKRRRGILRQLTEDEFRSFKELLK